MASLYEISNDIFTIFNNIESKDGEITDEEYNALCIKQEELKSKLDAYVKAVKEFQADADFCKKEKQAINDRQNVYKNRVERLKHAMLDAVCQFGEHGKNNMFIELPTCRIFTKDSKSIEIDEERINIFMNEFERFVRELCDAGVLYTGNDIDVEGILNVINANCKAEHGEDFIPFTISDLTTLRITISQNDTVYNLFKNGLALNMYGKEPYYTNMEVDTPKDDWKKSIECTKDTDIENPTIAKIVINKSIQIK